MKRFVPGTAAVLLSDAVGHSVSAAHFGDDVALPDAAARAVLGVSLADIQSA